jgi:Domain of unknown function (DUF4189)
MRRLSVLLVSAVMALTLIALAVATGASAQQQGKSYAAVHQGNKAIYYGDGTSKAAAIQDSLRRCEAADTNCTGQQWVYNGWLAIAEGKDQQGRSGLAYSYGHTEQEAQANAIKTCKQPPPWTGCKGFDTYQTVAYDPNKPTQGGPP